MKLKEVIKRIKLKEAKRSLTQLVVWRCAEE
jgi:hypothetical protein